MPSSSRPSIPRDFLNLDTIVELLQAVFDAHIISFDGALELLQLAEFIQAEIHARHGDELRELLLGSEDDHDAASQLPF